MKDYEERRKDENLIQEEDVVKTSEEVTEDLVEDTDPITPIEEESPSKGKIIGIVIAGAVVLAVVMGIIFAITISSKKETSTTNTQVAETVEEVRVEEQATVETVEIAETVETTVEEQAASTEEAEEETTAEAVEMVDWETWATQSDNDEVCMVVWNEETGTQKVLEEMPKDGLDVKKYSYTVQEGDRFFIPRRDNIMHVWVSLGLQLWKQDGKW